MAALGRQRYFVIGERRGPVVSSAGLKLHIVAVDESVRRGTPGRIADSYLIDLGPSSTTAAAELCRAGVWERVTGGYQSLDQDFLEQVVSIQNAEHSWWRGIRRKLA
jgi:hypothetical protein